MPKKIKKPKKTAVRKTIKIAKQSGKKKAVMGYASGGKK